MSTKEIDRETLDRIATSFNLSLSALRILDGSSLEKIAQVVEHVGRRLRDECCEEKLRGPAILANQILTIATTE